MPITKTFSADEVLDALWSNHFDGFPPGPRPEDGFPQGSSELDEIIYDSEEFSHRNKFEPVYTIVFEDEDGSFWQIEYEINPGSGWHGLANTADRPDSFLATRVQMVERMVFSWVPVADESADARRYPALRAEIQNISSNGSKEVLRTDTSR